MAEAAAHDGGFVIGQICCDQIKNCFPMDVCRAHLRKLQLSKMRQPQPLKDLRGFSQRKVISEAVPR